MRDRVFQAALAVSLAGHCVLFGLPGMALSPTAADLPVETVVRIEIENEVLLPEIDVIGEEKKLKNVEVEEEYRPPEPPPMPESEPAPEPQLEAERPEVVADKPADEVKQKIEVDDPAVEAMFRYQDVVKQKIQAARRYPLSARRRGTEGVVALAFTVVSDGHATDIVKEGSSGSMVLDEEAMRTIKRASPFPPFPRELRTDSIRMRISIVYSFK